MKTFAIIGLLIILIIVFCVNIEIDIDGTIWKEHETDRSILVLRYNEDGVTYKYIEDPFERHMTLWNLITKYTYEGE